MTPTLAYYAGSTATGSPLAGAPSLVGTYTVVATFPGSAHDGPATSAPVAFAITKATPPAVTVTDAGGTYWGEAFPATASVTGLSGPASFSLEGEVPTLAYYAGSTATGTPLAGAPTLVGTYTVVATFPGSYDYTTAASAVLVLGPRTSPKRAWPWLKAGALSGGGADRDEARPHMRRARQGLGR